MKKIIISALVLCILIILPDISDYYKNLITNFYYVPEKFIDYQTFDNLSSNSKYTIKKFTNQNPEYPFKVNDSIVCIVTSTSNKNKIYYKINRVGNITDSLSINDEEIYTRFNYLVNQKKGFYLSWLVDGDTIKKPIQIIGKGKIFNHNEVKNYTHLAYFADYEFSEHNITKEKYVENLYLKNNSWFTINTKERYYEEIDLDFRLNFKTIDEFGILEYFHKEEWQCKYFYELDWSVHSSFNERWVGTSYYTTNTFEKINFKREESYMHSDKSIGNDQYSSDYQLYESPLKNFMIFTRNISGKLEFYLIKKILN